MGQGLATVTPQLRLVNKFEVLFVLAVSQQWILPFKMVNEYSRNPDFCLLVHKA